MLLTKEEVIAALQHEVRLVLHLASKIHPAMLDYRPSVKQRSMLELMQYFAVVAPVQLRTIVAGDFTMDRWRKRWQPEEAAAKAMNLEETRVAIANQPALFAELTPRCVRRLKCSDARPAGVCGSSSCRCATTLPIACSCFFI